MGKKGICLYNRVCLFFRGSFVCDGKYQDRYFCFQMVMMVKHELDYYVDSTHEIHTGVFEKLGVRLWKDFGAFED